MMRHRFLRASLAPCMLCPIPPPRIVRPIFRVENRFQAVVWPTPPSKSNSFQDLGRFSVDNRFQESSFGPIRTWKICLVGTDSMAAYVNNHRNWSVPTFVMDGISIVGGLVSSPLLRHPTHPCYPSCSHHLATLHARVLDNVRRHYPSEFIYLYSDCSVDYKDIAEKYNCHYVQRPGTVEADGIVKAKSALKSSFGVGCNQVGARIIAPGFVQRFLLSLDKPAKRAHPCLHTIP